MIYYKHLFTTVINLWKLGPIQEIESPEVFMWMASAEPPENVGRTEVPARKFDMIQSEIRGLDKSGKQLKFFRERKERKF